MYIPDLFKNENQLEIEQFINDNSFAIIINQSDGKLCATHIPFVLEINEMGKKVLSSHVSIENPQGQSFKQNQDVLVIFSGPQSYISSSWYDHENVPTWNYLAVHVYGQVQILDLNQTIKSLKKLIDKFEINSDNPVRIEDLSKKTMLQARSIIGFEIEITNIQAVKKLSQNRDNKNYQNIISELEKTNKPNELGIAIEMKKCTR